MVPIILGLLGVPIWLLAGWILGRLWHRHVIKRGPGAFQLKARMVSGVLTEPARRARTDPVGSD